MCVWWEVRSRNTRERVSESVAMKVTVTVCDVCEQQVPTRQYEIRGAGRLKRVDLCEGDAQPVEKLFGDAKPRGRAAAPVKKAAAKRAAKKTGGRSPKVTTMDQVEAKKKTAKR